MTIDPTKKIAAGLIAAAALAALASPAGAEGLQPGQWKVTSTPTVNGQPAPPQEKMRCMSAEETADLGKAFTPEARTVNSSCERVEYDVTGTTLSWRLKCEGQMKMDVAGAFKFETPQRYVAEIRTAMSMPGQSVTSSVKIEGERVGDCP